MVQKDDVHIVGAKVEACICLEQKLQSDKTEGGIKFA